MADVVDKQTRSRMMSGIRGKNTKPELIMRSGLHTRGFRFILHNKQLPGKPDIVLPRFRTIVLVHGCFWHGHDCHLFKWPSSRPDFWKTKIENTKARDRKHLETYQGLGWRVITIWECALKGKDQSSIDEAIDTCSTWITSSSTRKTHQIP